MPLDSLILLVIVIVQGIRLRDLRRRLDATQHYHSIRLEARINRLEGKPELACIMETDATRWVCERSKPWWRR